MNKGLSFYRESRVPNSVVGAALATALVTGCGGGGDRREINVDQSFANSPSVTVNFETVNRVMDIMNDVIAVRGQCQLKGQEVSVQSFANPNEVLCKILYTDGSETILKNTGVSADPLKREQIVQDNPEVTIKGPGKTQLDASGMTTINIEGTLTTPLHLLPPNMTVITDPITHRSTLVFIGDSVNPNGKNDPLNITVLSLDKTQMYVHNIDFKETTPKNPELIPGGAFASLPDIVIINDNAGNLINSFMVDGVTSSTNSPIKYEADGLPEGITIDPITGRISGSHDVDKGYGYTEDYFVTIRATSGNSVIQRGLTIRIRDIG